MGTPRSLGRQAGGGTASAREPPCSSSLFLNEEDKPFCKKPLALGIFLESLESAHILQYLLILNGSRNYEIIQGLSG
jgi:hypothetical protein